MEKVVLGECVGADILIMAAAVSDWTPVNINDQKMQWEDIIKLHNEIFTHLKQELK